MQFRIPWILSRKRLIAATLLDSVIFIASYTFSFRLSFERWPDLNFSIAFFLIYWLIVSYVIGRYPRSHHPPQISTLLNISQQLFKTLFVALLSTCCIIVYYNFFKLTNSVESVNIFLLQSGILFCIISSSSQVLFDDWIRRNSKKNNLWTFIGSQNNFHKLQNYLQWSRVPAKLYFAEIDNLNICSSLQIVVDNYTDYNKSQLDKLLHFQQTGITIITKYSWCELILQRFPPDLLTEVELLRGEFSMPQSNLQTRIKRLGDVIISLLLLISSFPLIFFSCFLIFLEDGNPIFYSQIRSGLSGKSYRVWKLRTMYRDSEKNGPQWGMKTDPRVTKIGYFLRKFRIDELPQLLCVLNGTMSLIGPRPERPEFDVQLEAELPFYKLRYKMRPGLSGWAQVNYPYGASVKDSANKLSYDLYYLRNASLWLDLLILVKTIRLVFNAQGSIPVDKIN